MAISRGVDEEWTLVVYSDTEFDSTGSIELGNQYYRRCSRNVQ